MSTQPVYIQQLSLPDQRPWLTDKQGGHEEQGNDFEMVTVMVSGLVLSPN